MGERGRMRNRLSGSVTSPPSTGLALDCRDGEGWQVHKVFSRVKGHSRFLLVWKLAASVLIQMCALLQPRLDPHQQVVGGIGDGLG